MEKAPSIQSLLSRSARWPLIAGILALTVLAAAILLTTLQLRRSIHDQIVSRDGEVLHAVVMMEYANEVEQGLGGPLNDPVNQLGIVLKTSELRGVLGIRLFDAAGRFVESFPPQVTESTLDPAHLGKLRQLKSSCRFHPALPLKELFYPDASVEDEGTARAAAAVLEVNVPLHEGDTSPLAGIAQFLIEGSGIEAEFARLDRQLAMQAGLAFVFGGGILLAVLWWAFKRLRRAHSLVERQAENLLKANRELALAAKTSALGTVTAHLIHGLKNPLAGLQSFVANHSADQGNGDGDSWEQAAASTRRMNGMIQRVISVLREEQTEARYGLTAAEAVGMVSGGLNSLARERGLLLAIEIDTVKELDNRAAQLVALILENLVQNAIEASPAGGKVTLRARTGDTKSVRFEVLDEGPGFPDNATPFNACRSTKQGGSGIGLALCRQLANHLGATLELRSSSDRGCHFVLELNPASCANEADDAGVMIKR